MQPAERVSLIFKITFPLIILILFSANPRSYAVVNGLRDSRIAQENQRPEETAANLRQVILREPWRIWLWEEVGFAEYQAANLHEAEYSFLQAKQAGALSPQGYFQLGEVYALQKNIRAAEETWQLLLREKKPLPPDLANRTYDRLVQLQSTRGDFRLAVTTLQAWHVAEPTNPQVSFLLGLHLSIFDPDQALPFLLEASDADPVYTATVQKIRRGIGQAREGDDPGYGWLMVGRGLGSAGYWDLAREAFQRSVEASPEYAEAWAFLGEARFQTMMDGQAQFERALVLNPDSVIVRAILGLHFRRLGNYDLALKYLLAVALQEPDEPMWQVELANTWADKGDLPVALGYFQKAVDLAPGTSQYWQYLARFSVEYDVSVRTIGLPAARQAVILAPQDSNALDVMGWTMVYLGDYISAERFLQEAIEQDPANTLTLLHLGQLYIQKQEMARGYPYLKRASLLSGEDSIGLIARRLLLRYYNEGS